MRCAGSPPGTTMKIRKTMNVTAMHTRTAPIDASDEEREPSVLDPHLRARVERVAQAVAEDVERQHGQHDRDARRERQPRPRDDQASGRRR